MPVHKGLHPLVTWGVSGARVPSTPVPSRYIGQGRDSKPSESGVKPDRKKSSGRSFRFPPGPGWTDVVVISKSPLFAAEAAENIFYNFVVLFSCPLEKGENSRDYSMRTRQTRKV
jgi:hypothetical protein